MLAIGQEVPLTCGELEFGFRRCRREHLSSRQTGCSHTVRYRQVSGRENGRERAGLQVNR